MPFRPIQWARRSIEGRQNEADGSRLLNFYAVQLPDPTEAKVPVMIYSSPGQKRFLRTRGSRAHANAETGVHALLELDSVVYGHWLFGLTDQQVFFAIRADPANGGSYQINRNYSPFDGGSIYRFPLANTWSWNNAAVDASEWIPADRPGKMVTDGRYIMWVSPSEVWVFDMKRLSDGETNPFASVTAPAVADLNTLEDLAEQNWVDCLWVDGYFMLAARSGQFFHSNVDSLQFDQLDFAEAGSNPDSIVGIETLHRRVYILGDRSIESWYNAGLSDFAFARDNSATVNIGCAARATIAADQFVIGFLGNDSIVYALSGGFPQRISSESVEYDIQQSDPTRARAVVYTEEGHRFYSLTLVYDDDSKKNWVYDFTTGVWHERLQTDILCTTRWRKRQTLIGLEGKEHIYDMRLDWGSIEADDDGEEVEIYREAISPLLFANLQRFKMRSISVDIPLRADGETTDEFLFEWSDDGKRTWKGGTAQEGSSKARRLDTGPRFRFNRLGQTRTGRHLRLSTSAKRRVDILGVYVDTDVAPD